MDRFIPPRYADRDRTLDTPPDNSDTLYAWRLREVLNIEKDGSLLFRGRRGAEPAKAPVTFRGKVRRAAAFDIPGASTYGKHTSPCDWGAINDTLAVWVPSHGVYVRDMRTAEARKSMLHPKEPGVCPIRSSPLGVGGLQGVYMRITLFYYSPPAQVSLITPPLRRLPLTTLRWSHDCRRLALADGFDATLVDVATGACTDLGLGSTLAVEWIGPHVAAMTVWPGVLLVDMRMPRAGVRRLTPYGCPTMLSWSTGNKLAVADRGTVSVFDLRSASPVAEHRHTAAVTALCWRNAKVAYALADGTVSTVANAAEPEQVAKLQSKAVAIMWNAVRGLCPVAPLLLAIRKRHNPTEPPYSSSPDRSRRQIP